jgi:two-component system, LytTR family, response regulator LytT
MKIIIIEDERLTAEDLHQTLLMIDAGIEIMATIRSVQEGLNYFTQDMERPDLIFSDIRLGDGLSFEILEAVKVPVIFCTAYDEYALKAFQANGIGYILKPFTEDSVREALDKYKQLIPLNTETEILRQYQSLKQLFSDGYRPMINSLLINQGDKVLPIRLKDIAVFYMEHTLVHIVTFDNRTFGVGKSLDELEAVIGTRFFRANRQYLINRDAVLHASSLLSRKMSVSVSVRLNDSITVSREKATQFLDWLRAAE